MFSKDVNNSYDNMFDLNRDGKLDSAEYSEQLYYINEDAKGWSEYRTSEEAKKANAYIDALCDCAEMIFGECQKAENIYNVIEKEWRESGAYDIHQIQFDELKSQLLGINKQMLDLEKNHVRGYEGLFNALLDFYNGYVAMTDCLFNTNGSYDSYTRVFLSANDSCMANYQNFEPLVKVVR